MKTRWSNPLGTPVIIAAIVFAVLYFGALATDRDELANGILGVATIAEAAAVIWGLNSLREQLRAQTLAPKIRLGATTGEPDRSKILDQLEWPNLITIRKNYSHIILVVVNAGNASLEGPVYRFHRVMDNQAKPLRFSVSQGKANEMTSDASAPIFISYVWDDRDGLLYAGEAKIFVFNIFEIAQGTHQFKMTVHAKNLAALEEKDITFEKTDQECSPYDSGPI